MKPAPRLPVEDLEHVTSAALPQWEQLRHGRIFVTGATGFFGTWLLESFAFANQKYKLNAELVGLTRDPESFRIKCPHLFQTGSVRLHRGDVREFEFPAGNFSHVIHAGTTSGAPVPDREMLETIFLGTRRALDFAEKEGVKRFLFVSSGAVYGRQPPDMLRIPETYSGGPDLMDSASAYGEGKRVGEMLCAVAHRERGLETTIARCFAFVGPHLPLQAHFAIGNFIHDAMRGGPIRIKDGRPLRSYLYASDLARWLWSILLVGRPCHPYNVGSDDYLPISEIARLVALYLQISPGPDLEVDRTSGTISAPPRYVPDIRRAQDELGLAVAVSLEQAILKTANWAKAWA